MYTKRLLQEQLQAHVPSAQRNTPAGSQIQSVPVIPKNVQTAIAVVAAVALVFALAGFLVSTASFTSSYGLGWTVIASFEGGLTGMIGCTLIATTSTFVLTYILCAPKRIAGVNQNITPPSRQAPVIENEDADSDEADIRLTRNGGGAGISESDSREPDELSDDRDGHTNSEDVNGEGVLSNNNVQELEDQMPSDLDLERMGLVKREKVSDSEEDKKPPTIPLKDLKSDLSESEKMRKLVKELNILRSSTVDSSKSRRKLLREKIEGEKNAHSADEDISEEEVHKERKAARLERRKKTKRSNSADPSRRSSSLDMGSRLRASDLTLSINSHVDTTAVSKEGENNLENLVKKAKLFDDESDNNNKVPPLPKHGPNTGLPPMPSISVNRSPHPSLPPGGVEGRNDLADQLTSGRLSLKKVGVKEEREKPEVAPDNKLFNSILGRATLTHLLSDDDKDNDFMAPTNMLDSFANFDREITEGKSVDPNHEEEEHKVRPTEGTRKRRKQTLITYEHQQHLDRIEAAKNSQTGVLGYNDEISGGGLHESVKKLELELPKYKEQNEIQLEQFKIKYKQKHGHELNLEVLEYRTGPDLEFKKQLEVDKKRVQSADRETLLKIGERYPQECKALLGTPEDAKVRGTKDPMKNSAVSILNRVKIPNYDNSEYQTFIQAKREWEFYCQQLREGKSNDEATLTLPEKEHQDMPASMTESLVGERLSRFMGERRGALEEDIPMDHEAPSSSEED